MFVSIAQIIIALLSGGRLGPMAPGQEPGRVTSPYAAPPCDTRIYEAKPRSHWGYEELTCPTPSPERR